MANLIQSALNRVRLIANNLDRDKKKPGFQLRAPMVSPQQQAPHTNAATSNFAPIRNIQSTLQQAEMAKIRLGKQWDQGVNRVKKAWEEDPLQFTPLSMREQAVPQFQGLGKLLGYEDEGTQAGYAVRGALSRTPFQRGGEKLRASAPQTERQQKAEKTGQVLMGTALTAPIGGSSPILNVLKRGTVGTGLGAALGGGIAAITGGDIGESAKGGAVAGLKAAPVIAVTNPITQKVLSLVAPGLGFGASQITQRTIGGLANVIEDEIISKLDGIDPNNKDRLMSLAIGAVLTGNDDLVKQLKTEFPKQAEEVQKGVRRMFTTVTTNQIDPKTGERITKPMIQYQLEQKIGLQAQDINDLSPKEAQKIRAKVEVASDGKAKIKTRASTADIEAAKPEADGKRRKYVQSVLDSKNVDNQTKVEVAKNESLIQTKSQEKLMREARKALPKNTDEALGSFFKEEPKVSKLDEYIAKGQVLAEKLDSQGRFEESATVHLRMAELGTQSGRAVKSFDNLKRLSPSGMLEYARKTIDKAKADNPKVEGLTDVEQKQIFDLMDQAAKLDDTDPQKRELVKQALEVINQKIPVGVLEWIDSFRFENMLSNPKTQARNIYSNAFNAFVYRPATLASEATADWMKAALTGSERKAYISDVPDYYKTLINTHKMAIDGAMGYMKDPVDLDLTKTTKPDLDNLSKARLPGYLTNVSRFMEAADRYFQAIVGEAEYSRNIRQGIEPEIAKGKASAKAQELLYRNALDPANKTGQGEVAAVMDKISGSAVKIRNALGPAGRIFVPFIQTPMNVLREQVLTSPAGFLNFKNNDDYLAQAGKSIVGSLAVAAGAGLAMEGRTTWAAPTDSKEKDLFYASGRKPFSIKIGNKWVPMYYFGPMALSLAVPAAAQYFNKEEKGATSDSGLEKIAKIAKETGTFISSQSSFANIGQLFRIIDGDLDSTFEKQLAFTSEQFLPAAGLVRYVNTLYDPVYRKAATGLDQLKKDYFFQSKDLEPYTKPDGTVSEREPVNLLPFVPYSVGFADDRYDVPLTLRQQQLQDNAVKLKAKKDAETILSGGENAIKQVNFSNPEENVLANYYGLDKVISMPENSFAQKVKKEKALYSKAISFSEKALEDGLSQEQIDSMVEGMGINPSDLEYYTIAKENNDVKSAYIQDEIQNFSGDHGELLVYLGRQRRAVNGKYVLANGVVDDLVDEGIITYNEGKMLKKLDFNPKTGQVKVKQTGRGSGAKYKLKVSLTPINTLISAANKASSGSGKARFRIKEEDLKRIQL